MKHAKRTSGRATAAISKPQQTAADAKPAPELIEKALNKFVALEMESFNSDLAIARGMWQANRSLVESKTWPEPFRTAYMQAHNGQEPQDDSFEKAPSIEQLRKQNMKEARELATKWANEGRDTGDSGVDIADSLRRTALREAQTILADLAEHSVPIPVFDALLFRDLMLTYNSDGLLAAIEDLCGLPSSKAA
jgi:hypothetical protein